MRLAPPALVVSALSLCACRPAMPAAGPSTGATAAPPAASGAPVTPAPSAPAATPEERDFARLKQLATKPWGTKRDRQGTLHVPLPDAPGWIRVSFWGIPTRVGFRYGADHLVVSATWYQKARGKDDPASCLAAFVEDALPRAERWGIRISESPLPPAPRGAHPAKPGVVLRTADGMLPSLFSVGEYFGGVASHPTWPGTCLVQGFAVLADTSPELARIIVARWVHGGAQLLDWEPTVKAAPTLKRSRRRRRSGYDTSMVRLRSERVRPDDHEAGLLLLRLREELRGDTGKPLPPLDTHDLVAPTGALLMLYAGSRSLACAGVRVTAPGVAELAFAFAQKDARGADAARLLLRSVERAARDLGAQRLLVKLVAELGAPREAYLAAGYADADLEPGRTEGWLAKDLRRD